MKVFTVHEPSIPPLGLDFLITFYDDGTGEFATRPGKDQTHITWSPPTPLRAEAS